MFVCRTLQRRPRRSIDDRSLDIAELVTAEHGDQRDDRRDRLLRIVAGAFEDVDRRVRSRRQLQVATAERADESAVLALGIDDHRVHAGDRGLEHERADREALAVAGGSEHCDVGIRMARGVERGNQHGQAGTDRRAEAVATRISTPGFDPGDATRRGRGVDEFAGAERIDPQWERAHQRRQVAEMGDLHTDQRRRKSEVQRSTPRVHRFMGRASHRRDDREMERASLIACEPLTERAC